MERDGFHQIRDVQSNRPSRYFDRSGVSPVDLPRGVGDACQKIGGHDQRGFEGLRNRLEPLRHVDGVADDREFAVPAGVQDPAHDRSRVQADPGLEHLARGPTMTNRRLIHFSQSHRPRGPRSPPPGSTGIREAAVPRTRIT